MHSGRPGSAASTLDFSASSGRDFISYQKFLEVIPKKLSKPEQLAHFDDLVREHEGLLRRDRNYLKLCELTAKQLQAIFSVSSSSFAACMARVSELTHKKRSSIASIAETSVRPYQSFISPPGTPSLLLLSVNQDRMRSRELLNLGKILEDEEKTEQAISKYEKALELMQENDPDKMDCLNRLGNAYYKLGGVDNLKRAIKLYESVLSLMPDDYPNKAEWYISIGSAYWSLGGEVNLSLAIKYFRPALGLTEAGHPDFASRFGLLLWSCTDLALHYYNLGGENNFAASILKCRQAIAAEGVSYLEKAIYWSCLAVIYIKLGGEANLREARDCYKEAFNSMKDHPNEISSIEWFAYNVYIDESIGIDWFGYINEKERLQLFDCYTQALNEMPDNYPDKAENLYDMGCKYCDAGGEVNFGKAVNCYKQALSLMEDSNPNKTPCLKALEAAIAKLAAVNPLYRTASLTCLRHPLFLCHFGDTQLCEFP